MHIRIAGRTAPLMFGLAVTFLICQAILIVMWVDVPALRQQSVGQSVGVPVSAESVLPAGDEWSTDGVLPAGDESSTDGELSTDGSARREKPAHPRSDGRNRPPTLPTTETERLHQAVLGPVSRPQIMLERTALGLMCLIWPIVITESIYHMVIRPKTRAMATTHAFSLLFCLCPSLRMCARSVEMRGRLWLPGWSWQRPDRRLRRRLEQSFSIPMIGIALLIVPVLVVEFLFKDQVARYPWLRGSLYVGTGVIWFAFAAEFILMISIAEKKIDYLRRHWVDLAIIALPFFSFLRSLRAIRGTSLARVAKVPQLTKLARAYRLRGTVLRAFRALVILNVSARLFQSTPEKQLRRLRLQLTATQRQARTIRLMIARIEREILTSEEPEEERTGAAGVPKKDGDS